MAKHRAACREGKHGGTRGGHCRPARRAEIHPHKQHGFTLIEVLLAVGILSMIAAMSLPIYLSFSQRNDLDIATTSIVSMLRRAETYSRGVNGDSGWGVEIESSDAVLFKGASFASRDTGYDETVNIPASVTPSGLSEVLFSKFTATPNSTGSITLTLNSNNVRTVSINAKGMVDY